MPASIASRTAVEASQDGALGAELALAPRVVPDDDADRETTPPPSSQ